MTAQGWVGGAQDAVMREHPEIGCPGLLDFSGLYV